MTWAGLYDVALKINERFKILTDEEENLPISEQCTIIMRSLGARLSEVRDTDIADITRSAQRSVVMQAPEAIRTFEIRVPNHDDGESLGVYESGYLPRQGDRMLVYHPAVTGKEDMPFEAVVSEVTWDLKHKSHKFAGNSNDVEIIVWLAEFAGGPTIYCTCSEEELKRWPGLDERGFCENCGHERP